MEEIRNHWQELIGLGKYIESDELLTMADSLIKMK